MEPSQLNSDGTLGFPMKLKSCQSEEVQALGGSIPLILDMCLTFGDTLELIKVEIAKVIEYKGEAETFDASSGAVTPTCIRQTVDFMGDALREQGKDPSQLKLFLNADGMRGSSPPGL